MILLLAEKYSKPIAFLLLLVFTSGFTPALASLHRMEKLPVYQNNFEPSSPIRQTISNVGKNKIYNHSSDLHNAEPVKNSNEKERTDIGGPNQPEMSSFKSVGTDNMVDLFTGDFSYNIPLMDVGGYPVNIFYDGGVTMEQEASWVGLGWNINPGTINRNMRGVPDDFDGTEVLQQTQQMKANKTWGVRVGADVEVIGIKSFASFSGSIGGSVGISVNNYLGPALDLTLKGSTGLTIANSAQAEKNAGKKTDSAGFSLGISGGLSANLSSRNGLTFSPNVSLTASANRTHQSTSFGFGASTSYNSRTGIKALQLSEQVSFSNHTEQNKIGMKFSSTIPMFSTSISFAKPTYIPAIRMPLTNSAWSGHFQLGAGIFGFFGSVEAEVFQQKSEVEQNDVLQKKPLVGYLYAQNAAANPNAVMDFTRFNDGEVTPHTPIISAPQYAYDVFSIQGEGTGGSIRAYRNDLGYVRDNKTTSRDKNLSLGADVGIPGHYGANFNTIKTPSTIGEWESGNKLRTAYQFMDAKQGNENVYFRSPGETSVLNDNQYNSIGGTGLVRYKLGGTDGMPTIEPVLEQFSKSNQLLPTGITPVAIPDRKKRTQVTSFLTAAEAQDAGLEKEIRNYQPALDNLNNLQYLSLPRIDEDHKAHHISQINVTEANGKRYIYGIPVYNLKQKDFTFTVDGAGDANNEVVVGGAEPTILNNQPGKDGYLQITETPAYAHSFLLTGLLSSDYVDITGDGITEDDMGGAVKFNYIRTGEHQWKTPMASDKANFNAGLQTEKKDDKGLITWGRRESWYVHSIESKTMIAMFTLEDRHDGKGVDSEHGGINPNENSVKRLKKIDLYSKADLKKNGLGKAKPIKTVWFKYDYSLCPQSRDNDGLAEAGNENKGKLALKSIYFTFNGKNRLNKNRYVFSYDGSGKNAPYAVNASDRWGTYKPADANPATDLKNSDYPYSIQDKNKKGQIDNNASSWSLNKILLPSGGQIEVSYESDDYAFVQNKRAADMLEIAGFGKDPQPISNKLYSNVGLGTVVENTVVAIKVSEPCSTRNEVYERYIKGQQQLAFKLEVNMPKGPEFVTSYAEVEDYGNYPNDPGRIWIKVKTTDGISPLSLTAVEFLREQLPGQAFRGYDVSESSGLKQAGEVLLGMLVALKGAFSNPLSQLRGENKAQTVVLGKSFVRLNDPDGYKYGGGHRVKTVRLKDNWNKMTGQYTASYGKEYDYTTTEVFNGAERTISSGVASYEPSIGGEENPFQTIVQVANKLPLGPSSYGAVELPVLDAFFNAPVVGYSKVSVRSLQRGIDPTKKSRSGIGKQVTEFYTAKDFPVYYNHTGFDPASDKQAHQAEMGAFFYKYAFDSRALSQGFVVETNDMHGKMKSQSSYAENDLKTRINYTENFYRNTGGKGLDEKFQFVYNNEAGKIKDGNMGVDIELMTDTREFSTKSTSLEVQAQVDLFPVVFPFWLPFIWPVFGNSENVYRAVTTTKVISYHSILDSVVVFDKGSQVATKNLVYDAETGNVVVSRTNNEFNRPVYNVNYPAYWAYSGMGLAYKNIDALFSGVNFLDGKITNNPAAIGMIESGDELLILHGDAPTGCSAALSSPSTVKTIWALNKNKNVSSLTNLNPDLIFIDKGGNIYNRSNVTFRIIRSGKRNILDASVAGFTALTDPRIKNGPDFFLNIDGNSKVINATAMEFKEKWQTDDDVIKKVKLVRPNSVELVINGNFASGYTGFTSGYAYSPAPTNGGNEGRFTVASNPQAWNTNGFQNCLGHTLGGNMMIVNGATDGRTVWQQAVTVTPNTNYVFSGWAQSISTPNPNPALLKFVINNTEVGNRLQLTSATCSWTNFFIIWNSGNTTTAVLSITDLNTQLVGNDFALDDISFKADDCGMTLLEQEDCNGELEKHINPYVKGLLGNFKTDRSLVFYAGRKESDPIAPTDIKKNGTLDAFFLYWAFNGNNLAPAPNTKWVWNSQITRVNAKGQELETKDALEIYTSAQYGHNKSIPVAITNNSAYSESFYAGMEDENFSESLNSVTQSSCDNYKHIIFNSVNYPQAHSGKYAMLIAASTSNDKMIPISSQYAYQYPMVFQTDAPKSLFDLGGNIEILTNNVSGYITSLSGNNTLSVFSNPSLATIQYSVKTTQYLEIQSIGMYNLKMTSFLGSSASEGVPSGSITGGGSFHIYDLNGAEFFGSVHSEYYNVGNYQVNTAFSRDVVLCPGIYKIVLIGQGAHEVGDEAPSGISVQDVYSIKCTNASVPMYKSLATQSSCTYTKPLAGIASMLNGVFGVPPSKLMLFSAWVKENCPPNNGVPCSTYANNEVNIQFSDGTSIPTPFKPSGPIIEGWQKVEGTFTAPSGTTQMTLSFANNGSSPSYYDDIRIHPFNANMKSYVYDPVSLRLTAELDANNYATFYEYDEEGTLIRVKAETKEGIKTIKETRSFQQTVIKTIQ